MAAARGSLYFEDMVHGPADGLHILAHVVSNDWFQVLLLITVIEKRTCIGERDALVSPREKWREEGGGMDKSKYYRHMCKHLKEYI